MKHQKLKSQLQRLESKNSHLTDGEIETRK